MYRVTVTAASPNEREEILLACTFQTSDDGENWTALEGAPSSIALPLSSVRGALRLPTDAEQRAALQELIRTTARALSALKGAVAIERIEDLLPTGWPVAIDL